jgi:hypothetical protein
MKKLWQRVREYMPMAAMLLLCIIIVPAAQANTNNGNSAAATQHTEAQSTTVAVAAPDDAPAAKATNPKAANKPCQKSVLDAEVLESPIGYFRNAFSSEEDEADVAPNSGAVMIAVKALVATLLSTIM